MKSMIEGSNVLKPDFGWYNEPQQTEIVEIARNYINSKGGFEKFAEWGLI